MLPDAIFFYILLTDLELSRCVFHSASDSSSFFRAPYHRAFLNPPSLLQLPLPVTVALPSGCTVSTSPQSPRCRFPPKSSWNWSINCRMAPSSLTKTYNLDARDSQGRTRNEARNWINPSIGAEPRLIRIELYDPATRTRINVFPLAKTVRQWTVGTAVPTAPSSASAKPETITENIGSDSIEGLPVRGLRVSQTYHPGALGNDRPLTIITESWYSGDLKINLLTKRADPRYGVQTVRVTELVRQEPDSTLFAIPDEYKLIEETVQQPLAQGFGAPDGTPPANSAWSYGPTAGIARAGIGGVTAPRCVYCPQPAYSNEARAAKLNGTVVLKVVVTADGRAENVQVMNGPGSGLERQAIEAVKNWRFKPR